MLSCVSSHRVVDGRGVHVDAAVILGNETELVGFGLHLHCSFTGHLVVPLWSSYLNKMQINKHEKVHTDFQFLFCSDDECESAPGPHWDREQHTTWQTSAGCCQS